jgi:hypothetical protein
VAAEHVADEGAAHRVHRVQRCEGPALRVPPATPAVSAAEATCASEARTRTHQWSASASNFAVSCGSTVLPRAPASATWHRRDVSSSAAGAGRGESTLPPRSARAARRQHACIFSSPLALQAKHSAARRRSPTRSLCGDMGFGARTSCC